jgi:hypothetical protein
MNLPGYLIILITASLLTGCSSSTLPEKQITGLIDSIVYKWVPDKRENLCDVSVRMLSKNEILVSGETNLPGAKAEILRSLENSGVKYTDSLKIVPYPSETDKPWGLVSVSVCNIKKKPSHSSELSSQAVMGTPVKILKKSGGWFLIQTPDFYIGWANDSGISELGEKKIAEWRESDRLIYTSRYGDILSENDNGEVISDIVSGSVVNFIAESGKYYFVRLPDGREGKIDKKDCRVFKKWCSEIKPDPDKLISFAKSLMGSPYLWGGTSTKMSDCSGFVKTVYFTGGIILARDASLQFQHGRPVSISPLTDSLEPGDLVFFGYRVKKGEKRIIHVGIYTGNTEVIHNSGMVSINSLDSTRSNYSRYLGTTIMGARRIIGEAPEKGTGQVNVNSWYVDIK